MQVEGQGQGQWQADWARSRSRSRLGINDFFVNSKYLEIRLWRKKVHHLQPMKMIFPVSTFKDPKLAGKWTNLAENLKKS